MLRVLAASHFHPYRLSRQLKLVSVDTRTVRFFVIQRVGEQKFRGFCLPTPQSTKREAILPFTIVTSTYITGRPRGSRGRGLIPCQCWWLEVVPKSASTRLRRIGLSAFGTCSISTMKIMRLTISS